VSALLELKFPNRPDAKNNPGADRSKFVQEIKAAGYSNLKNVQADIERGYPYFIEHEKKEHKPLFFSKTGAARGCLFMSSEAYWSANTTGRKSTFSETAKKTRKALNLPQP
jgi:hypothetical protein